MVPARMPLPPLRPRSSPLPGESTRGSASAIQRTKVRIWLSCRPQTWAARAAGHPRIPAPPTFAAALRPNDARAGIEIDWKNLLHGEQEFEYRRPLYAGDFLTLVQVIKDIYEKTGKAGTMDFLVLETTARDGDGNVVYVARGNIVVKR